MNLTSIAVASLLALSPASTLLAGITPPPAAAAQNAPAPKTAAPEVKPLTLGDPAPAFAVDTWIKGESFDALESGKVHVLEFWATWCGPCIAAIPHLTELQKKYPDVRFVGVAASESGSDDAAKLAKVKSFVEGKGDVMGYRVAYVGDRAKMSRPWMEASGQSGIPCTFIVDASGRVAWIGHPMEMDKPLEQIVKGEFDIEQARKSLEEARAARAAQRALMLAIRQARESGDYGPVVDAVNAALEKTPTDPLRMTAVQIFAGPAKRPADAWKVAEDLLVSARDNPVAMNQLAWIIVDPKGGVAEPNLDIAMRAAVRACELTQNSDGAMLDTLARVHFAKGDVAEAARLQRDAVAKTADGPMKDEMKATLEEYESSVKKG